MRIKGELLQVSNKRIAAITPPCIRSNEFVVQELEDELLIYNLQTNQAICLNQTAALVWRYCDGKSEVSEIVQKMEKELGASVKEELVLFAISELNDKGLIENGEGISNGFDGLSRREIVKKVGFASLVALPIVSSIVAPKAVNARSPQPCLDPGAASSFRCGLSSIDDCLRLCSCCDGGIVASIGCHVSLDQCTCRCPFSRT